MRPGIRLPMASVRKWEVTMRLCLIVPIALSLQVEASPLAPVRFLALGDSFTAGTGATPGQAFPARLAARWRAAGRAVALENLGVNGYSTLDLIRQELPRAKEFGPTRVTLAIGANDLVRQPGIEAYREHLRQIFGALAAAGIVGPRIWVLPQPDWAHSPSAAALGEPEFLSAEVARYNEALRQEAVAAGATYVDLSALMKRQSAAGEIADDGLHPSAQAYDEWAQALAQREP
jgi:acyl-CoA thioesterase-1